MTKRALASEKRVRAQFLSKRAPPKQPNATTTAADATSAGEYLQTNTQSADVNNVDSGAVLLYAFDRTTGRRFLVDSGSAVTLLPAGAVPAHVRATLKPSAKRLFSAGGNSIVNYGQLDCDLDMGFSLPMAATIIVADVQTPILGIDFLGGHELLLDAAHALLVRRRSNEQIALEPSFGKRPPNIHAVADDDDNAPGGEFFRRYPSVLRPIESHTLPRAAEFKFKLDVRSRGPEAIRAARRLDPDLEREVRDHFDGLLDAGFVRRSKSPWAAPLHVVRKKNGKLRCVGDYRALNAITVGDKYPMPHIGDLFGKLRGKTTFSLVDLKSSFFHVGVDAEDIEKTAVLTPFGLFECVAMSFGFKNAPAVMQRYMDTALRGVDSIYNYIDDVLVATSDDEDHDAATDALFARLDEWGLRVNREKCIFKVKKIQFLGHIISAGAIEPIPERLDAIRTYPQPTTQRELRRFLGLVSYYRRFMPRVADRLAAFSSLLRRKAKTVAWSDELMRAFNETRTEIVKTVRLAFPGRGPMRILTDASGVAIAGALEQQIDGDWRPLSFYSRKLTDTERRYSTFDRELLAVFAAITNFRTWFGANECHILTDHKPLTFALTKSGDRANQRQCRQLDFISQYVSDIRYIKGADNAVADALSRVDEVDVDHVAVAAPSPPVQLHLDWARAQSNDVELKELRADAKFKWAPTKLGENDELWCDWSTGVARPYISPPHRRAVFDAAHDVAHPGQRSSRAAICSRYVWRGMAKDITNWVRSCDGCQRYKSSRAPAIADGVFPIPAGRCRHVHLDLVGPLPQSEGKTYVLTMIDRFTRWPEAVAVSKIDAATVAKQFVDVWVTRYGCPDVVTTDRGTQFTSELFAELNRLLGAHHITTTAYHPQGNGIVERLHRRLKEAICAAERQRDWARALPLILMVLRNTVKEDLGVAPAELLFGAPLSMPTDLVAPPSALQPNSPDVSIFRRQMAEVSAATSRPRSPQTSPSAALGAATHVYVRDDRPKRKFEPKFEGPFRVVERHERYYKIELTAGKIETISILRLKPALVEPAPAAASGCSVLSIICCGIARAKQLSHAASGAGLRSALRRHRARAATAKQSVRFDLTNLPRRHDSSSAPLIVESAKRSTYSTGPASVAPSYSSSQQRPAWVRKLYALLGPCANTAKEHTYADVTANRPCRSNSKSVLAK